MVDNNVNIFSHYDIGKITLKNRMAVAPMTRVSANYDGTANSLMNEYYQNYSKGGFGLIITEGLYTDKHYSQTYKHQPGLSDKVQASTWQPIIESVHQQGTKIIAQLMHAGALSQHNKYTNTNAAPSAIKPLGQEMTFYYGEGDYKTPKAMTESDIDKAIAGFVEAAIRAKDTGFDGVEIHGANGYLLDQFMTTYTNQRTDKYGGSLNNRMHIYQQILKAVKQAVGDDFVVGVRFSQSKVNDFDYKWPNKEEDAKLVFEAAVKCGVDYIHTTEHVAKSPAFDKGHSLAKLAKKFTNIPVIANGGINNLSDALELTESDQADIVSIGKAALANPDWPNKIAEQNTLREFDFAMFNPLADLKTAQSFLTSQV